MRPIFLTEEVKNKLLSDFQTKLSKSKAFDGKFKIEQELKYEKNKLPKATIWFTSDAWAKMIALVDTFQKEIAWQGIVSRIQDTTNEWVVSDIIVYKQKVTGAHVDTDVEEFGPWKNYWAEKADEEGACINFQGHSHVNMAVSPSGTDMQDQETRMADQKRGFYIFTIQNKKREANYWIYDFDNNIAYDTADIDVEVICANDTLFDFLDDAKQLVQEEKPITKWVSATTSSANPAKTTATAEVRPTALRTSEKKATEIVEIDEEDDIDNPYQYYRKNFYGDVYPYLSTGYYD